MTARRAKQIIYGALYLVIWVGIFAGIYYGFVRVTPSCFNKIQDQGETGVDCGGPCATACTSNLQNIALGDLKTFVSGPGHDTFLARVENHNVDFGSKIFNYSFDLYDASGTVLLSVPGQSFIYPGEVKYLLLPNFEIPVSMDHASLVMQNPEWAPSSTVGAVPQFGNPLTITGNTMTSSTVTVTGEITDSDSSAFANILIVAVFYDANGFQVGASQAELNAITPNQTENFSVSYPVVTNLNPLLTKAFAYALRP